MVKCYGCLTACGYAKGFIGVGLIALGVWMTTTDHNILNCSDLQLTCPVAFGQLALASLNMSSNAVLPEGHHGEIAAYCNCLQTCVNYGHVYERNPTDAAVTNCYRFSLATIPQYSTAAPVAMPGVPLRRRLAVAAKALYDRLPSFTAEATLRRLMDDPNPMASSTCTTCADVQAVEDAIFSALSYLAAFCGVALICTAFCEHIGMKWHSTCFSILVLLTDMSVSSVLATGGVIAIMGSVAAAMGCNTEEVRAQLTQAASESTNGDADQSALFANFLFTLFLPMSEAICHTQSQFSTFAMLTFFGSLVSSMSFLATCCICMGCSEDHEDPDDPNSENAQQIQGLMRN